MKGQRREEKEIKVAERGKKSERVANEKRKVTIDEGDDEVTAKENKMKDEREMKQKIKEQKKWG